MNWGEGVKERARFLRTEGGYSVETVASMISVPRQTVGDWLVGLGETCFLQDCKNCGGVFRATRTDNIYCSNSCRNRSPARYPQPGACLLCGVGIEVKSHRHKFCTRSHQEKWRKTFGAANA